MNPQGRVKYQVWLMIAVVFILGGVTGASLDRLYMLKNKPQAAAGPNRWRQAMMDDMKKEMNLTDDQVTQIRSVYDQMRKEFQPKQFAECPAVKEMRERTRSKIFEVLSPEQQKLYDEFTAKREADRGRHR
ncbi:MAG: hypothetical protein IPL01_02280 [Acidobacteria bacterium]|jgi:Spy/CpxP family protein refolding chaperone|nr:hypothetical protein [Acidobacteriota bacterium]MBK8312915.1 hypothetical protein [Acidobacteriota bacterium]